MRANILMSSRFGVSDFVYRVIQTFSNLEEKKQNTSRRKGSFRKILISSGRYNRSSHIVAYTNP